MTDHTPSSSFSSSNTRPWDNHPTTDYDPANLIDEMSTIVEALHQAMPEVLVFLPSASRLPRASHVLIVDPVRETTGTIEYNTLRGYQVAGNITPSRTNGSAVNVFDTEQDHVTGADIVAEVINAVPEALAEHLVQKPTTSLPQDPIPNQTFAQNATHRHNIYIRVLFAN